MVADGWILPAFAEARLARRDEGVLVSLGDVPMPGNDDPRWTVVGAVGSPGRAAVDERGLVTPVPGRWSLDWWVGADDRWHVPSREDAVVQRLAGGVPVVETVMKVPGGEAVQRVYGVAGAPDVVVVEVENASAAPFAVAFAVRPFDQRGPGRVGRAAISGTAVEIDGERAVALPRPPSRVATSTLADGDAASAVLGGRAREAKRAEVEDPERSATLAAVFPLAHRASIRVAVTLSGSLPERFDATGLPRSGDAVHGWEAHLGRGTVVRLPDEGVQRALDAARAHLLLLDDGVSITPVPWDGGASERQDAVTILTALRRWGFERHADEVAASVPRRWRRKLAPAALEPGDAWARAGELLRESSATVSWADRGSGAHGRLVGDFLLAVRDGLVAEHEEGVALLPVLPPEWRGRDLEVHRLPTRFGAVSYALRWHGERPALLWELHGDGGGGAGGGGVGAGDRGARVEGPRGRARRREVTVTAPGLDVTWSSRERSGETLLAPVDGTG